MFLGSSIILALVIIEKAIKAISKIITIAKTTLRPIFTPADKLFFFYFFILIPPQY